MMKTRIFSVLAVVLILAVLILAGPARGFTLNLTLDDTSLEKGDDLKFTVEIDILPGEQLPIDYLTLRLTGPDSTSCRFDPDGTIISGCDGISIDLDEASTYSDGYGYGYFGYGYNFGYGYGYQSGKLIYTITLDTSDYDTGTYETELRAKIGSKTFSQDGEDFTLSQRSSSSGGGSCRTDWVCSEWSMCIDGHQTRTCAKEINYCYAGDAPEPVRVCDGGLEIDYGALDGDEPIQLNFEDDREVGNETGNLSISRITGAVTGVLDSVDSNDGIIVVLLIALIIVTLGIIIVVRRRKFGVPIRPHKRFYPPLPKA